MPQTYRSHVFAWIRLDREGRFRYANPYALELLGLEESTLRGRDARDGSWSIQDLTGQPIPEQQRPFNQVRRTGEPIVAFGHSIQRADGQRIWLSLDAEPLFDETGAFEGLIAVIKPLTDEALASALEDSQDGVIITEPGPLTSPGPRIIYVNPAFTEHTGYSPAEVIGETPRLLQGPDTDRETLKRVRYALEHSEPVEVELLNYRKDGSAFWMDLRIFPTTDPHGNSRHWVAIARDITTRKRQEEALADRETRLRLATEAAQLGIWDLDLTTDTLIWDARMYGLYGIDPNRFDGKYRVWHDALHPEDRSRAEAQLQAALRDGVPFATEFRIVMPTGAIRHIEARAIVYRDDAGEAVRLLGTNRDITTRKETERALWETQNRLQRITDNLPGVVLRYRLDADNQHSLLYRSAGVASLYGLPPSHAVDLQDLWDAVHPEDREPLRRSIAESARTLEPWFHDWRIRQLDGTIRWLHGSGQPEKENDGSVVWDGVLLDITDRKRAERELERMQRLESLGQLAAGLAHDFNNLLTGFFANLSLAQIDLDPDHPAQEPLAEAEATLDRARGLTNQLLTFAKGGTPRQQTVHLGALVDRLVPFELAGSSLHTTVIYPPDLWPAHIDVDQIQQVCSNLLTNAKEAMPEGGNVSIELTNWPVPVDRGPLKAGAYVRARIEDDGPGIAPEQLATIFDPYVTTKALGNGLGLAMVYSIITRHGGHVDVTSTLGQGTVFTLYYPAAPEAIPSEPTRL